MCCFVCSHMYVCVLYICCYSKSFLIGHFSKKIFNIFRSHAFLNHILFSRLNLAQFNFWRSRTRHHLVTFIILISIYPSIYLSIPIRSFRFLYFQFIYFCCLFICLYLFICLVNFLLFFFIFIFS